MSIATITNDTRLKIGTITDETVTNEITRQVHACGATRARNVKLYRVNNNTLRVHKWGGMGRTTRNVDIHYVAESDTYTIRIHTIKFSNGITEKVKVTDGVYVSQLFDAINHWKVG